jgi:hypothetical protein
MTANVNVLMTTRYQRNETGPFARTEVKLANNRLLTITTRRAFPSAPLKTTASVGLVKDGFVTHVAMRDYVEALAANKLTRLTEAAVKAQHDRQLASLPDLIGRVEAFYAASATVATPTPVCVPEVAAAAALVAFVSSQACGQVSSQVAGA